jgi:dihydrolipoamide dehydrogenase
VCTVDSPDGPEQLHASMMLVAAGREAITQDLGLEDLGVAFDGGFVRVDGWMRTNVPHLYAVGDVAGEPLLAHKATAEGRLAAEVIAGQAETPLRYDLIPRCTYSYPEVGSFGLSEEAAIAGGYSVAVGRFPLAANSRSAIEHERGGFVKFVMESGTEQILGLHAVGPTVCELIAGGVIAGNLDSTPLEIARSIHPHPTISEAFAEAAAALYGMATHA